jgi:hypothetical protein
MGSKRSYQEKLVRHVCGITVGVVARSFATGAVTTGSAWQLLLNSRGNPTSELLLKFSASNNSDMDGFVSGFHYYSTRGYV